MRPTHLLRLSIVVLVAAMAACARQSGRDGTRIELASAPATVGTQGHSGAYASGTSLSLGARLEPLVDEEVRTIQLDTVHEIIEIAPGVRFSAWTFGGQVPGPTVRARVGDKIRFSMTNRSDEQVPASLSLAAPMMHSMDFHAAMVSPQDKYRSIAPGQTIEFEFTLNYPGVFMYHCGTPMILEHIASGMYGAVVVEPRGGFPGKVDREYVLIQSEFYAKPDPEGRQQDGGDVYVLDTENLRRKISTYTVFNGRHNGLVDHPLPAKPGERVRLFVLNVGPSNTSSFHVVGTIFDKVWLEGNPANEMVGMQTVLLGSSQSAIVEFMIPEAGKYIMVDHHFANASQGAIGLIDATGATPDTIPIEHHNIPATGRPAGDPQALSGKMQFENKCLACHTIGGGRGVGPDLAGVTMRRTDQWLERWLAAPEKMLASDDSAKAMLQVYGIPMPNQNLSATEIRDLMRYLEWADRDPMAARPTSAEGGDHDHEGTK